MLGTLNKLLRDESKATLILDSLLSSYVMPTEPSANEKRSIEYNLRDKKNKMSMKYFINHYMEFEGGDENVYKHLQRILLNYGSDYPRKDDDLRSSIELFQDFFKKLIAFWSGNSTVYMQSNKYKVKVINSPNQFPSSHTCFFELDLPKDISYETLYERLVKAVQNTDLGAH
jgi:hypothetical protein